MPNLLPKWKFHLIDTVAMSRIGVLRVPDRNLTLTHNAAGTASFRVSMENQYANRIWPITTGILASRWSPKTKVWTTKWSGYISDIQEDYDSGMLSVSAVGWLQWLEERILRVVKDYTTVNPATTLDWRDWEIIRDIILYGNLTSIPLVPSGAYSVPGIYKDPTDLAGPFYPMPLQWGGATGDFSTHVRKGWPAERGSQLLDIVKRLCDIENGCDIRVDPVTRKLYVHDVKQTIRSGAQFGFQWGPRNIKNFRRSINTQGIKNYFEAMGPDTLRSQFSDSKAFTYPAVARTMGMPALGEDSMQYYGLMEEGISLSDAKNEGVLGIYAAQEVFFNSSPRLLYDIIPMPFYLPESGNSNTPEPFEDYEVGDKVYLTAKRPPRIFVKRQGIRVFSMNISIDNDNDSETLGSLQVSPT